MAGEGDRLPDPGDGDVDRRTADHADLPRNGHPDLDTLALLDADALDGPTAQGVHAHVAACATCRVALDRLAATTALLRALPPVSMPEPVAARLDAALAAERGTVATADPAPRLAAGGRRTPSHRRAPRHLPGRWAGWLAAAVLVVGGGTGAVLGLGSLTGGGDHTVTQAAHNDGGSAGTATGGSTHQPRSAAAGGPGLSGLPTYTRDDIGTALTAILDQATCGKQGSCGTNSAGPMADSRLRSRCTASLDSGSGTDAPPEAVQYALFEGRPAFVFVFGGNHVVVVDSDCGRSAHADVLFQTP